MTGLQSLEARSALGGFFAILSYVAASSAWIHRGTRRFFDRAVNVAFIVSRFSLYITAFFILRLPMRGDIPSYYAPEAQAVLHHQLPYRDFPCSYAPLHPFLDAALLLLWHSPLVIALFAILVECFLLPVWLRAARVFASERAVRIAAVLYLTSAISLQFVTIDGQDNVLIALLLGLGVLVLARHRAVLSGVLVALGAVLVKFLPLLFAPAFFLACSRRLRWLFGFVAALVVGYGYFAFRHLPLLFPLQFESTSRTASDLPYLIEGLFNLNGSGAVEDSILALALLAIVALLARVTLRRSDEDQTTATATALRVITFGCAALNLTLLLFSKKSWPPYLVLTLFPLCLLIGQGSRFRLRVAGFVLFNAVAVTSHSIWATVFGQFLAPEFHRSLAALDPVAILFLFFQIALIAGYAWLLAESISAFRSPTPSPLDAH